MLCELEQRRSDREARLTGRHGRKPLPLADRVRQVLIEPLPHYRLIVERLHLRRRTEHVEIDGTLGLRREMRQSGEPSDGLLLRSRSGVPFEKGIESEC